MKVYPFMDELRSLLNNKKNIISLLLLGIMALGIPIGLNLLKQQQILRSRATGIPPKVEFVPGGCISADGKSANCTAPITLRLTSPFGASTAVGSTVVPGTTSLVGAPTNITQLPPNCSDGQQHGLLAASLFQNNTYISASWCNLPVGSYAIICSNGVPVIPGFAYSNYGDHYILPSFQAPAGVGNIISLYSNANPTTCGGTQLYPPVSVVGAQGTTNTSGTTNTPVSGPGVQPGTGGCCNIANGNNDCNANNLVGGTNQSTAGMTCSVRNDNCAGSGNNACAVPAGSASSGTCIFGQVAQCAISGACDQTRANAYCAELKDNTYTCNQQLVQFANGSYTGSGCVKTTTSLNVSLVKKAYAQDTCDVADFCSGSTAVHRYANCQEDGTPCPNGCTNGECNSATSGSAPGGGSGCTVNDFCSGSTAVHRYANCQEDGTPCQYGCSGGSCNSAPSGGQPTGGTCPGDSACGAYWGQGASCDPSSGTARGDGCYGGTGHVDTGGTGTSNSTTCPTGQDKVPNLSPTDLGQYLVSTTLVNDSLAPYTDQDRQNNKLCGYKYFVWQSNTSDNQYCVTYTFTKWDDQESCRNSALVCPANATACWKGTACSSNMTNANSTCAKNHSAGSTCSKTEGQANTFDDGCTNPNSNSAGSVFYRVTDNAAILADPNAGWISLTADVNGLAIVPFSFTTNPQPGTTVTVYAQFETTQNGVRSPATLQQAQTSIIFAGLAPSIVSCHPTSSLAADGSVSVNFTVTGQGFGINQGSLGKVAANPGGNLRIDSWADNIVSANLAIPSANTSNYTVTITRQDGISSNTFDCGSVGGASQIKLGANWLCQVPTKLDMSNVDLSVFQMQGIGATARVVGAPSREKVTISQGVISSIKTKIIDGLKYVICLKAPHSLRLCTDSSTPITATSGVTDLTTIAPFNIPFGNLNDDTAINTKDASLLDQQWGPVTGNKNCDFNSDGKCNSFEYSCMLRYFNKSDSPEPQ